MQSINTIARKKVKVLKLVQRRLIPYSSIVGLGAFRKIKYFGDFPIQLLCIRDLIIKSKLFKNIYFFLPCLFTTAKKSSIN